MVNGHVLASGRAEEKPNQRSGFDRLPTGEEVRRELGFPVLQGELHAEVEAPVWTKKSSSVQEFGLLVRGTPGSTRNSCSPSNTVGLTNTGENTHI